MTAAAAATQASTLAVGGAFAFGLVLGWFLYYLNRYRKDVSLADLTTVVGAIGGAAVLSLFPAESDLFGAYGVGLAVGFFGYLVLLVVLVTVSSNFGIDYLIDGRRTPPAPPVSYGAAPDRPMGAGDQSTPPPGA